MSWVGAGEPAAAGAQGGYAHGDQQRLAHEREAGRALHAAVARGDGAYVAHQLAKGAGPAVIEFRGGYGVTPLGVASSLGHARCAQLLIDAGANLEAMNVYGETALFCASESSDPAVASLLLAAGAKVDSVNCVNKTPLIWAAFCGSSKIVKLLLGAGSDKEHRDRHGMTALDYATVYNKPEVATIINEYPLIVRAEAVACSGIYMPEELAELCGDYVAMTPERHAIQARQERK
jgi:ankyrin repeat protein